MVLGLRHQLLPLLPRGEGRRGRRRPPHRAVLLQQRPAINHQLSQFFSNRFSVSLTVPKCLAIAGKWDIPVLDHSEAQNRRQRIQGSLHR